MADGSPPPAPAARVEQVFVLVQAPSPLDSVAAPEDAEQPVLAEGGYLRAKPRRRSVAAGGAVERPVGEGAVVVEKGSLSFSRCMS